LQDIDMFGNSYNYYGLILHPLDSAAQILPSV
jgi:hypothetical protein